MGFFKDGLINLQTRLGGTKDKGASAEYYLAKLSDEQIEAAYRSSWVVQKAVNIPVQDATRKWRKWEDDAGEVIEEISALEKKFQVRKKIKKAAERSRLFGGSFILFGVKGQEDFSKPLRPGSVGADDLKFMTVLDRHTLTANQAVLDPRSPRYQLPMTYELTTGSGETLTIHHSHLIEFGGVDLPRAESRVGGVTFTQGDSILQSMMDAMKNVDSVMGNMAALVADAKTDVVKIPDLSRNIQDSKYESDLIDRFESARAVKGNHGVLILDGNEDYQSVIYGLEGLPPVAQIFMQVAASAADIPMTRFMAQSPGGLNATGDGDLTNYYDGVSSIQENTFSPALEVFDEVLIRSAGQNPDAVTQKWVPLRQMTEAETAELQAKAATVISTLAGTEVFDDYPLERLAVEVLSKVGLKSLKTEERGEAEGNEGDEK